MLAGPLSSILMEAWNIYSVASKIALGVDISVGWKRGGAWSSQRGRLMWARPGGRAITVLTDPWRELRHVATRRRRETGKPHLAAYEKGIFEDSV